MNSNDKYNLIGNIISFIYSDEYDSTITNMARDCNVPLPYMRKTIIAIINNHVLKTCLYTNTDMDLGDDELSFFENYEETPDEINHKILNGDYDDVIWNMSIRLLSSNEDAILTLTHIEYGALKTLKEDVLSIKRGSLYERKNTISPLSSEVIKNKAIISDAIEDHCSISFAYSDRNNFTETITCYPNELFTNTNDNWIYLRSSEGKLYRLDRIVQNCKIIRDSSPMPHANKSPKSKYAWGAYFKETENPTHVKIKIGSSTPNMIQKIENDIAYRKATCKFYKEGDNYYFEDDIIGMGDFQRWVRSYGSSMIYLEPSSTRQTVLERAQQTLDNYRLSDNWSII
ncbi:WYL domain-containing protein [Butyrivibrio sp. AE3009]|uniref:WYL domain-containing protein n=1 Tax=Butyrivibrio sp. AE3009 TaxID=1280666 RepID=UPI0003B3157A|nr:WYL domain-containing protein [Butyrivibrio sp. AE3009]